MFFMCKQMNHPLNTPRYIEFKRKNNHIEDDNIESKNEYIDEDIQCPIIDGSFRVVWISEVLPLAVIYHHHYNSRNKQYSICVVKKKQSLLSNSGEDENINSVNNNINSVNNTQNHQSQRSSQNRQSRHSLPHSKSREIMFDSPEILFEEIHEIYFTAEDIDQKSSCLKKNPLKYYLKG